MKYRTVSSSFFEGCHDVMAHVAVGLISLYRICVSPFLPPACRFYPSCSAYAMECIEKHGILRGTWMSGRRLLRCHPFHPGGYDPVP
jgi:uncharacterized protein